MCSISLSSSPRFTPNLTLGLWIQSTLLSLFPWFNSWVFLGLNPRLLWTLSHLVSMSWLQLQLCCVNNLHICLLFRCIVYYFLCLVAWLDCDWTVEFNVFISLVGKPVLYPLGLSWIVGHCGCIETHARAFRLHNRKVRLSQYIWAAVFTLWKRSWSMNIARALYIMGSWEAESQSVKSQIVMSETT